MAAKQKVSTKEAENTVNVAMTAIQRKHGPLGLRLARKWLLHESTRQRVAAEIAEREKQLEQLKRTGVLPRKAGRYRL